MILPLVNIRFSSRPDSGKSYSLSVFRGAILSVVPLLQNCTFLCLCPPIKNSYVASSQSAPGFLYDELIIVSK